MSFDYQSLIDDAMIDIVRSVLIKVQDNGFLGEQCFYISFRTDHPEVIISKQLKSRYPEEITIVLQYQFKDLRVMQDRFSVDLSFGGVYENIEVPFLALTGFADPSVNFSLQFRKNMESLEYAPDEQVLETNNEEIKFSSKPSKSIKSKNQKSDKKSEENTKPGKIIDFNQFKNKN